MTTDKDQTQSLCLEKQVETEVIMQIEDFTSVVGPRTPLVSSRTDREAEQNEHHGSNNISSGSENLFSNNMSFKSSTNEPGQRGRRGHLPQEQRERRAIVRNIGACDHCRRRKIRVGQNLFVLLTLLQKAS